jgi:hypothetical protein
MLTLSVDAVNEADDETRVTVQARYPFHTTVAWPFWQGPHQLGHQVSMRQYR